MNCRSLAVALLCAVGLVPSAQAAFAAAPTSRHVTATATILAITTNDHTEFQAVKWVTKFINADGHVTDFLTPNSRPLIIIDMP